MKVKNEAGEEVEVADESQPEAVVEQPKTEAEQEYDAGFEEAAKDPAKPEETGLPHPHPSPLLEGEGGDKEKAPEKTEAKADVSKVHGGIESVEKALKDTKAYATKLSEEKAELERKLKSLESGAATAKEIEAAKLAVRQAQDNFDEVKEKVYRDYPEMKDVLDPLIETTRSLKKEVESFRTVKAEETETARLGKALENFNSNVKPEILKVHKDFDAVLKDRDYWAWAEKQRPSLKMAAMDSGDSQDIIYAVSEFKKFKASDEARELKGKDEEARRKKLLNAHSLRGGGSPVPFTGKHASDQDYDGGWEEAGRTGKKA